VHANRLMKDLYKLPDDLPVPVDDGACDHLTGTRIPTIVLDSVSGEKIDLGSLKGKTVVFFYPMHGHPDAPPMVGWNDIPGARGCTPQACAFRDGYAKLEALGVRVFGISSQPLTEQKEASVRLKLPYELLNDSQFRLTAALKLPTFQYADKTYIKRITIICGNGVIKKTFYPVFPPDKNIDDVIAWLAHR
jgi:peroxiredoxin